MRKKILEMYKTQSMMDNENIKNSLPKLENALSVEIPACSFHLYFC